MIRVQRYFLVALLVLLPSVIECLVPQLAIAGDFDFALSVVLRGDRLQPGGAWATGLSAEQLRILRNATYARHGRAFNSQDLQNYFYGSGAKAGIKLAVNLSYHDGLLDTADKNNVAVIQAQENGSTPSASTTSPASDFQTFFTEFSRAVGRGDAPYIVAHTILPVKYFLITTHTQDGKVYTETGRKSDTLSKDSLLKLTDYWEGMDEGEESGIVQKLPAVILLLSSRLHSGASLEQASKFRLEVHDGTAWATDGSWNPDVSKKNATRIGFIRVNGSWKLSSIELIRYEDL